MCTHFYCQTEGGRIHLCRWEIVIEGISCLPANVFFPLFSLLHTRFTAPQNWRKIEWRWQREVSTEHRSSGLHVNTLLTFATRRRICKEEEKKVLWKNRHLVTKEVDDEGLRNQFMSDRVSILFLKMREKRYKIYAHKSIDIHRTYF